MGASVRLHRRRGATLIEAMVALALLALSVAGIASALIAASRQDRVNDGRAAAQQVANELAAAIGRWDFDDARLAVTTNNYADARFSDNTVTAFTVTRGNGTTPSTVTETLAATPDYDEDDLGTAWGGRSITVENTTDPGRAYVFKRYWNVRQDTATNQHLKLVAVQVTYNRSVTQRGVVTAFTAVSDNTSLARIVAE